MNWELLQNSLSLSALVTALALLFGALAGLALAALPQRPRQGAQLLLVLGLAMPPFVVANTWLRLFGYSGSLRPFIDFNIFSFSGSALALTVMFAPITALLVGNAWRGLNPALIESEPRLRAGALLRNLLVPAARPQIMLASILTFVLAFNHFAIPALFQTKVYPVELWIRFNTTFDYTLAMLNGLPLVIIPALGLLLLRRTGPAWPRSSASLPPQLLRQRLGSMIHTCALAALTALCVLGTLPLWQILGAGDTWTELSSAVAANARELGNSGLLAFATASICVIAGALTSQRKVVGAAWILFFVPGALVGVALIWLLNRPGLAFFYQSLGVALLALSLRYIALGWTGARAAFQSIDKNLVDTARLAGASKFQTFRHAVWPHAAPRLLTVWLVIYLLTLWDVDALSLITPPGGETLSWRAFNLLHYGHTAQVNALSLMVLALAAAPLLLWAVASKLRSRLFLLAPLALIVGCGQLPAGQVKVDSQIFESVQVIGTRGAGAGQFNKPRALACDRDDNLYVADITGRIQKFSPEGHYLLSWQMPQTDIGKPKGMDRDSDGNIIVIEPHYSRVNHFDGNGKLVHQWGVHGTNSGLLSFPRAVAVTRDGSLWLSEYGATERVQLFSKNGAECLLAFGVRGSKPSEFDRPEGIGIGREGELLVADSCNHRIQIFSPEGKFLSEFGKSGSGAGELGYPSDVRADFEGRIYVAEFGNSRIQMFDRAGKSIEILGSRGGAPGEFFNPWSIAFDSRGNLYVADAANHRVQKFIRRGNNVARAPKNGENNGGSAG